MSYIIEFKPSALRQLKQLSKQTQKQIQRKIENLKENPLPTGVKKLIGSKNLYRIRVGDYRIIYTIESEKFIVLIIIIGHRREIYR